jgi:hypothetical protein
MAMSKFEWAHGVWHSIHITGAWTDSPDKFTFFCIWIRNQLENLPCFDCIEHSRQYLLANPPEKAEDAFIWTWRYHNAVNRRLGKPEMDYKTAKQLYLEKGVQKCNAGCGNK